MTSLNRIFVIAIAGLAALAAGCKPSSSVTFKPALVSIDIGPGWARADIPPAAPACTPRLMGKPGMINAIVLDADIADLKTAANNMQTSLMKTSRADADSFKQQDFTTDTGLAGLHLSYTAKAAKAGDPELHSHNFITRNRRGQFVSISYITSPDVESPAVITAIQKTLQVE